MKTSILGFLITACLLFPSSGGGTPQGIVTVPIRELITSPEKYSGKKISTRGYYTSDGHSAVLCTDAAAARGTAGRSRIFLDLEHSSVPQQSLAPVRHGYVNVTGTFQYRKFATKIGKHGERVMIVGFGWMNTYEKQITSVTSFSSTSALRQ